MTIKQGKKLYHITSPLSDPDRGRVIAWRDYMPGLKNRNEITIATDDGRIITDYQSNFTTHYPAICKYWNA